MRLTNPSFAIVPQKPGIEGMYKQIELCGRISHKSEDKIDENSYNKFIAMMEKLGHYATFEHGAVYLAFGKDNVLFDILLERYSKDKYSKTFFDEENGTAYVSTNYRVLCENGWKDDLAYWCEPTKFHEKRHTVIFICDIGVSREYNRHRADSILEESTRYCDYTKDKFENELSIVLPVWLKGMSEYIKNKIRETSLLDFCKDISVGIENEWTDIDCWLFANMACEWSYETLIKKFKWKAQEARTVLPLDTKSTLAHTAFESDWKHFFDLRAIGTTGEPHPSAKELAEPLMHEFEKFI